MNYSAEQSKIPRRILGTLITSCSAGVVPRNGLEYIAIGRNSEIDAIITDLENVGEGMGGFRFLIGRYGSGKSFLIGLIRANALERGFVTSDCDLSPDRRFVGRSGQGISVFRELMKNLSTKSCSESSALTSILTKWLSELQLNIINTKGIMQDDRRMSDEMSKEIFKITSKLEQYVNGFEFAKVLTLYYRGYNTGDEQLKSDALKWLRGEFSTRTEAKRSKISVASIIDDTNWYEFIKLYSLFFRIIGYRGFVVFIDECVNLYKIPNRVSRENNYEKILSMFNDTLQGKAEGLEIILGGTPQFLEDERRGLYSYDALKSRLKESSFKTEKFHDLLGPVIRIERLSDEELYALVMRFKSLHATYYDWTPRITDEEILSFLQLCYNKIGADSLLTPREVIRDFLGILNILNQNPNITFDDIIKSGDITLSPDIKGDEANEDEFFDFAEL